MMTVEPMYYSGIKYYDIANGVGVRTSLFVSGCTHHCKGCFNPDTWSFTHGDVFTDDVMDEILKSCSDTFNAGLTLLGGEPFEPRNQRVLIMLVKKFKELYPTKTIWCYSGYTYEELKGIKENRCRCEVTDDLLKHIDVLVDGEFMLDLKDISLRFKGSSNQRILDVAKTEETGTITEWHDNQIAPEWGTGNGE